MKTAILVIILILFNGAVSGQNNDTWTAFRNQDSTRIGFRDNKGNVKIEPRFLDLTPANRFDHIIAVMEEENGSFRSGYLTKTGGIVGIDSLYIFDNMADCESEGFIRFRDSKSDRAGLFNRKGDIVIPAEYNDLTRVMNGMLVALRGAGKKYSDPDNPSASEHVGWSGGTEMLIDTSNRILVDGFRYEPALNFYSLKISGQPDPDPIRRNFTGTDGKQYSFIDFEKEFRDWLKKTLTENFTKKTLLAATCPEITYWQEDDGWITEPKNRFMNRYFKILSKKLLELNSPGCEYGIWIEGLNPFIFDSDEYQPYFNNCGEPMEWIYPVMNVIITHRDQNGFTQDHFDFLRTADGYKLMMVSVNGMD
jgi:hypothetical protein